MTAAIRALAEQAAPRYTSYPTAPHFTADVGPATYAEWLAALPPAGTLSLYLHVPYCVQLCSYCGCNTKATRRREPIDAYCDQLVREIADVGARAGGGTVVHIHWGGGTPSTLGPDRLIEVFAAIRERFGIAADLVHAFELDPRYVNRALAQALAEIGVNRASLGVQELTPRIQRAIGRIQPFDVVAQCVDTLREAGIDRVNFDLMYGLPGQTAEDIRNTVARATSLRPQRVAYFGYAHVPWLKKHQNLIDQAALPGAEERLEQSETARAALVALGYELVGFDHFALPDDELAVAARERRLRRNFQGYTTDPADALIGFGASAIGRLGQGFIQNQPAAGAYMRAIASGQLATVKGFALSPEDRLRGLIIERLMCDLAVELDRLVAAAGSEVKMRFDAELAALAPLEADGLVSIEGNRIAVTDRGRPLVRLVAAAFDTYLATARARHSVAV